MTDSRNSRRTLQGVVSSSSAAKTITVRVERLVHPRVQLTVGAMDEVIAVVLVRDVTPDAEEDERVPQERLVAELSTSTSLAPFTPRSLESMCGLRTPR